jgi:hypothetical protein
MGGINFKEKLCYAIKTDDAQSLRQIIEQNNSLLEDYINLNNDYTALCLAAHYGSLNCIKTLIEVYIS